MLEKKMHTPFSNTFQRSSEGFNKFHLAAKILLPLINEKHPEYLKDDYSIK